MLFHLIGDLGPLSRRRKRRPRAGVFWAGGDSPPAQRSAWQSQPWKDTSAGQPRASASLPTHPFIEEAIRTTGFACGGGGPRRAHQAFRPALPAEREREAPPNQFKKVFSFHAAQPSPKAPHFHRGISVCIVGQWAAVFRGGQPGAFRYPSRSRWAASIFRITRQLATMKAAP